MNLDLRPAQLNELPDLSALCVRSKAYWGYDDAFMAACMTELTLTPQDVADDAVIVMEDSSGLAGVAHVCWDDNSCYLDKLFVEPNCIGKGYGKLLYEWALGAARNLGAQELIIEADPDAAAFYTRMGAERAGDVPSGSIAGRVLPRFIHPL